MQANTRKAAIHCNDMFTLFIVWDIPSDIVMEKEGHMFLSRQKVTQTMAQQGKL